MQDTGVNVICVRGANMTAAAYITRRGLLMAGIALSLVARSIPAYGQAGDCCMSTQQVQIPCQSQNCKGTITILTCQGGGYGPGQVYPTIQVKCCTSENTTLGTPSGACVVGGGAFRASQIGSPDPRPTRRSEFFELPLDPEIVALLPQRLVWVRNCGGAYTLATIPHS
jgi:hypothetical protein